MSTPGTSRLPPTVLARGELGILPRAQRVHRDLKGTRVHSCRLRSPSDSPAGSRAARLGPLSGET
eukprot:7491972-Alexandrium_andersonii.AAC.1